MPVETFICKIRFLKPGDVFLTSNNRLYRMAPQHYGTSYAEEINGTGHVWVITPFDQEKTVLLEMH